MFRPYILGFSILLLSACGTKGETQLFALGLGSNQSPQAIFDVRVESVAIDNNQSYLNAINVQPWGKFDALDLKNLKQSLGDTFARNLPEESSTFESKLNVHLFIRRYVVSTSNTGGGVLATVTWAVTDSEGKLVFDEQFYAWSSGYLITTVGLVKTSAHKQIVRRIAITSMALASNTPAAEIRPAAIANTSTSLDEAISGLPKTLVSMGNQGLAAFPSSTISTIGLLTPSGAMDVQWEPSELSETFDWPEYLANISGDAEEIAKLNAELAKRQGREEIAKLNAELAKRQGREPIEILGVYDSVVKSNRGRKPKSVVVLARSGNEIRGKSIPDSGDRITGTLQNNKIQFRWTFADSTYDRMGTLKIKDSRNDRLEGTWANTGFPPGTWKLSKTGPGEATDIDGLTFTASKE